jgi:hypothetical protein
MRIAVTGRTVQSRPVAAATGSIDNRSIRHPATKATLHVQQKLDARQCKSRADAEKGQITLSNGKICQTANGEEMHKHLHEPNEALAGGESEFVGRAVFLLHTCLSHGDAFYAGQSRTRSLDKAVHKLRSANGSPAP